MKGRVIPTGPVRDQLGGKLRAAREACGWSLRDAWEESGIPRMTIGSWERGDRVPTPDALWRLAQMYGVRIEEFYPPQGDVPQTRDLRPVLARVLALVGDALNGDGAGEGS